MRWNNVIIVTILSSFCHNFVIIVIFFSSFSHHWHHLFIILSSVCHHFFIIVIILSSFCHHCHHCYNFVIIVIILSSLSSLCRHFVIILSSLSSNCHHFVGGLSDVDDLLGWLLRTCGDFLLPFEDFENILWTLRTFGNIENFWWLFEYVLMCRYLHLYTSIFVYLQLCISTRWNVLNVLNVWMIIKYIWVPWWPFEDLLETMMTK